MYRDILIYKESFVECTFLVIIPKLYYYIVKSYKTRFQNYISALKQ